MAAAEGVSRTIIADVAKPRDAAADAGRMTPQWFDAADLAHATHDRLAGILEWPSPLEGPALELHLFLVADRTLAVWFDENGVPWRAVIAARS